MKVNTTVLAGTAILAALVVVFDYTVKYSNLKIPFAPLPYLKFDFTGIPIVLSFLLFGLVPSAFTSAVAFVAILARSGDVLGSLMKGLAEFLTILGMAVGLKLLGRFRIVKIVYSFTLGVTSRALLMVCINFALIYAGIMSISSSYADIPLFMALFLAIFNIIQGTISVIGGYSIYEAIRRRASFLVKKVTGGNSHY